MSTEIAASLRADALLSGVCSLSEFVLQFPMGRNGTNRTRTLRRPARNTVFGKEKLGRSDVISAAMLAADQPPGLPHRPALNLEQGSKNNLEQGSKNCP
jgi:hypothetical protein